VEQYSWGSGGLPQGNYKLQDRILDTFTDTEAILKITHKATVLLEYPNLFLQVTAYV